MFIRRIKKIILSPKGLIGVCLLIAGSAFGNTLYIQAKAQLAQYFIKTAWVQTVAIHKNAETITRPQRPWAWADTHPVAKLSVPKFQIEQYVLAGATGSPLAFGPGHYAGTRLPGMIDVQSTLSPLKHTVIAGHHNTHFNFLKQLTLGDTITIENYQGKTYTYQITRREIFNSQSQQLPMSFDSQQLTLLTCLPRYVGELNPSQRLVITAKQL